VVGGDSRSNSQGVRSSFVIPVLGLLLGAEKSHKRTANVEKIRGFLGMVAVDRFWTLSAEEYAAIRAGLEKHGRVVGPSDLIIAATVVANNRTLITNNTGEFSRIPGLKLENRK
jgi:tRNA(fMet)-specific endonuclease VapC